MTATNRTDLGKDFHPFAPDYLADPFSFYQQLRSEAPVVYSPEIDAWLVTRYNDVRLVLSQPTVFSSADIKRPMSPLAPATIDVLRRGFFPMLPSAVNSDGVNHRRFREPYVRALSSTAITGFEGYIGTTCNALVDSFIGDGRIDIISQFAYPMTLEVILHIMGIPQDRMADAKQWGSDLMTLICQPLSPERQIACAHGLVAFQLYIAELIAERRSHPQDDLISEMITYQVPGAQPLATEELISALCGFLMAGQKTPIDLFGNGLAILLNPVTRWQTLCAHPEHIPSAIEEILRYEGPVQALSRTTTCEVIVGDVTLPAGANLLVICGSGNRDESQYPQAEEFDLERNPARHLAFGHGSHFCVGAPLARLMGQTVFAIFTQRLPTLHLVPGQRLVNVPALQFRGYQRLEVAW
ncbi:MAG: monooxygenase YjiB [Roseiflexaceae bacterium]